MAERKHTGRTVALVGSAALAAWLLSRGKGWGFRSSGEGSGTTATQCTVWIRAEGLELDGVAADLPTVIAKCRAVGTAQVGATGDAITGVIFRVLKELHAAGVKLLLPPDLDRLARLERL